MCSSHHTRPGDLPDALVGLVDLMQHIIRLPRSFLVNMCDGSGLTSQMGTLPNLGVELLLLLWLLITASRYPMPRNSCTIGQAVRQVAPDQTDQIVQVYEVLKGADLGAFFPPSDDVHENLLNIANQRPPLCLNLHHGFVKLGNTTREYCNMSSSSVYKPIFTLSCLTESERSIPLNQNWIAEENSARLTGWEPPARVLLAEAHAEVWLNGDASFPNHRKMKP
ncbi:hypothetical protein L1987_03892 [Smallanthus sonchifolius]|uniref:Uncharacterized protein n=1 Tax=Smallanthus sonchifolius TaxID=185202 RepID=A0ACB9KC29_9ASTR|nr:hypothetical protein L1987_03892 [Smallanthus sonchifolius]